MKKAISAIIVLILFASAAFFAYVVFYPEKVQHLGMENAFLHQTENTQTEKQSVAIETEKEMAIVKFGESLSALNAYFKDANAVLHTEEKQNKTTFLTYSVEHASKLTVKPAKVMVVSDDSGICGIEIIPNTQSQEIFTYLSEKYGKTYQNLSLAGETHCIWQAEDNTVVVYVQENSHTIFYTNNTKNDWIDQNNMLYNIL